MNPLAETGRILPGLTGSLPSTKRVAHNGAVLRHDVAAELEEVVYPVKVELRPHKYRGRDVEAHACPGMDLEMVRTLKERVR